MRCLLAVVVLCLASVALPLTAPASDKTKPPVVDTAHAPQIAAARTAADAWLKVLDNEKYDESWKTASSFFQAHVPQAAFERRMAVVRKAVDPVITRDLNTTEYRTELHGLPKGEYVAFVWETVFGDGKTTLESLVMTNENGAWKMIGYAVQS